jgi:hypothetical protein
MRSNGIPSAANKIIRARRTNPAAPVVRRVNVVKAARSRSLKSTTRALRGPDMIHRLLYEFR